MISAIGLASKRAAPGAEESFREPWGARRPRTGIAAEAKQGAMLAFAGARDLDDIIALVGAGPVWCLGGETLECGWFATRRTPGYVTVARFAGVAGRKVALTCAFGPDANLLADSCAAKAARSSRPPRPYTRPPARQVGALERATSACRAGRGPVGELRAREGRIEPRILPSGKSRVARLLIECAKPSPPGGRAEMSLRIWITAIAVLLPIAASGSGLRAEAMVEKCRSISVSADQADAPAQRGIESFLQHQQNASVCRAYFDGFLDGWRERFDFSTARAAELTSDDELAEMTAALQLASPALCNPGEWASVGRAIEIFIDFVGRHPEIAGDVAHSVIPRALAEAYPCPAATAPEAE